MGLACTLDISCVQAIIISSNLHYIKNCIKLEFYNRNYIDVNKLPDS